MGFPSLFVHTSEMILSSGPNPVGALSSIVIIQVVPLGVVHTTVSNEMGLQKGGMATATEEVITTNSITSASTTNTFTFLVILISFLG